MKNIKIGQTGLCTFLLLSPFVITLAALLISAVIAEFAPEGSLLGYLPAVALVICIPAVIAYSVKYGLAALMVLFGDIESINAWKKDRQFYFTDVNGRTAAEAEKAISLRMSHYANELPVENKYEGLLNMYKKRRHSWFEHASGFEDYYALYKTESLSKGFCSAAVANSKRVMRSTVQKGKYPFLKTKRERIMPVMQGCALVIICNFADDDAKNYVRNEFSKDNLGLAICICEMSTGRYYINGKLLNSDIFSADASAMSMSLIKKVVFCNKMGLKENEFYTSAKDLTVDPEKTLYEVLTETKSLLKNSWSNEKKMLKNMQDGDIEFDGEQVYYKCGDRGTAYMVLKEDEIEGEEPSDKVKIIISDTWSYPKNSKMSKADRAVAEQKITEYLRGQNIDFELLDFDEWLEKQ